MNIKTFIKEVSSDRKVNYKKAFLDTALEYRRDIENILVRIINEKHSDVTIRIFQNKGRRDDLIEKLFSIGLSKHKNVETQLDNILGKDYCIAINFITSWSQNISDFFRNDFMDAWIEEVGITLNGADVYAFLGKYNETPFGLHEDDEDSFLIGLGPNSKPAFVEDNRIDGIPKNQPYDNYMSKYLLEGGYILYIPQFIPHILQSPEYTVMLGVAPYPLTEKQLFDKAYDRFNRIIQLDTSNKDYGNDYDIFKGLISKTDEIKSEYTTLIQDCLVAESMNIRSSNFLIGSPMFKIPSFTETTLFQLKNGHKLLLKKISNQTMVFANGNEILINDTSCFDPYKTRVIF